MEEGLLFKAKDQEKEGGKKSLTWDDFLEEAKKVGYIAGSMVAANLSLQLISVISLMMVGHLGEIALAGTAMATSLCAVSGSSLLVGMASGLETLCGQAYGAQQYQKLGVHAYSAMISLILVCIPISFVWISMEKILIFIGQYQCAVFVIPHNFHEVLAVLDQFNAFHCPLISDSFAWQAAIARKRIFQ
ncbi:hypothetical protein MKW98_001437 [Papaver atlanticum]|uniref:Uncharacterized protein n=1 Tax=Papaver atlanticum TaxID=357466 RepID=A0AAD4SXD9_9MAGN|nr:hypothetical protein MKW98_001437 [Papaver atlanticum]